MKTGDSTAQSSILIGGRPVSYRKWGAGTAIVVLPGWGGPTDKYDSLLNKLASRGYLVVLPDLPGLPGKTSPVFMPLKAWARWVEELAEAVSGQPFVLVSHSLSARIALEYLTAEGSRCLCAIFIGPWLISSPVGACVSRFLARVLRFLSPVIYPDMKWVFDGRAWKTAARLISAVRGQPRMPCLVVFGERDPARRLFSGWKGIGCKIRVFQWGHSPQVTATSELAAVIDEFIRKNQ